MAHVRVNVDEDPCAADEDGDIDRLIREADDDILGRGVRQLHPNLHSAMVSRMQMGQRMLGGEEEDDDDDDEQRVGLIRMPRPAKKVAPALPSKALKRAPPMTPIGTPAMATVAVSKETRQKKKPKTEEPQPVVVKAVPPPSKSKAKEPKPQPLAAAVKRVAVVDEEKKEAVQEAGKKKRKVPTRAAKKTEPSKEKEETTLAVTTTMGMPPTPPPSSIQEAAAVPEITPAVIVPAVAEKKPMTQAQSIKLRLGKASTFPCEDDLDKCAEWVLLALYTTKLTGVYGGYYDPAKVGNHALHTTEASFLFYRHLYLRTQVAAAWQKLCDQSGNADMATIARLMPHCKMYIDPKPKVFISFLLSVGNLTAHQGLLPGRCMRVERGANQPASRGPRAHYRG
jgi:hypothetical protein